MAFAKCKAALCAVLHLPWLALPASAAELLNARPLPAGPQELLAEAPRVAAGARATWGFPSLVPDTRIIPHETTDSHGRWLAVEFPSGAIWLNDVLLEDWRRIRPAQRHQIEWRHRWLPAVRFGVSEAPPALLSSLAEPNWRAYLERLRREHGARIQLAVDDDTMAHADLVRIFGARTRVLVYDLAPLPGEDRPSRVMEIAVDFGAHVLVFSCDGPADHVREARRAFERLVTRAERPAT
jgi:hypothetical protein